MTPAAPAGRLPASIWALGFVSLLMDVSSELIHSLLPVFMVSVLGVSMLTVGLLEGAAEATALFVKVFSGTLSDWWGKRKPLALLGYGLGAATKPLFALATSVDPVITARLLDRVGKGLRGAPRDALIADITPEAQRGAAFGLRQSLDTVGAFLGPILAIVFMLLWANDIRTVFWVAVIPAVLCVALLAFGVSEPERPAGQPRINPLRRDNLRRLKGPFWNVAVFGGCFTLARFSEAFLVLRAQGGGLPMAWVPAVLIAMNMVFAAAAYPLGSLADRVSHRSLLSAGMVLLILADLCLAYAAHGPLFWLGIVLWGLHMAATQGLLAAMVADTAPADLRGTAYGLFNLVCALALLVASALAGWLWDRSGPSATFVTGAALAMASLLLLWLTPHRR
ncbi:MFS transporter [Curvibacter sp. APW13]|uniref:MFS transporter n=1 Tax=Curvibacter sp. APW13 TaxID=3077236 RepID=UPI0028DDA389|nr:MFS transporter [Curvibacter sp. APW13]MDT8991062.1 MFS transporter [Curvibacter sp. APW13]